MELIRSGAIPLVKTNAAEMKHLKIPINYLACLICSAIVILLSGHAGRYREKNPRLNEKQGYFGLTFYDGGARSFYGNKQY